MNQDPAIELRSICFRYAEPLVLENIDLTVQKGEFIGIVGPSGGGKSTLVRLILGLHVPSSGKIRVLGKAPKEACTRIGYAPQTVRFRRDFPIRVRDVVLQGRLRPNRWGPGFREEDHAAADLAMQALGISEISDRPLTALSGGQLHRVIIARALCVDPEILILDEPTASLDVRLEAEMFDFLQSLIPRTTILVISHDIAFISQYVTRVACLNRTLELREPQDITVDTIQALYERPVRAIPYGPAPIESGSGK